MGEDSGYHILVGDAGSHLFSNTIMNYSLPEVATQYVESGTITAKIRGSGTVESGNPYNVEVTESRKVSQVAVKVGDQVEKDDVLMYLEDAESTELKEAKTQLDSLKADTTEPSWRRIPPPAS